MISLSLPWNADRPLHLLCLGAHPDDIEIGCGGTIMRLLDEHPGTTADWIVFSGDGVRETEARNSALALLGRDAAHRVRVFEFRDGYFPFVGAQIKDAFEDLKRQVEPSIIFTHWVQDAHQDHRVIGELTHCTFRNHLVLEYEIPKYDGDLGNPNVFLPLTHDHAVGKARHLLTHFPSQAQRQWFDEATFLSLARLRGIGCNARTGLAEAFFATRLVI